MKFLSKLGAFASLLTIAPVAVESHGTEVRYCRTTANKLRIFVKHWHNNLSSVNAAGAMTIEKLGGSTQTLTPTGIANDVSDAALYQIGCSESKTDIATVCSNQNSQNDWVYYDFDLVCNQPVTYKLIQGTTVVLTEACPELYPAVISDNFSCSNPPTISPEPSVAPSVAPTISPEPSVAPSGVPSAAPSSQPSSKPSAQPSAAPSSQPSSKPSVQPSSMPSSQPSSKPSSLPSLVPSRSSKKGKREWREERIANGADPALFYSKSVKSNDGYGKGALPNKRQNNNFESGSISNKSQKSDSIDGGAESESIDEVPFAINSIGIRVRA